MRLKQAKYRERGFTLTEALVSFSVTAVGLLTVVSFQGDLFTESAYNKARAEALSLAQQKIEEFKHYTLSDEGAFIDDNGDGVMDPDGSYNDDPITGQNAVFTRSWELDTGDQAKEIGVTVSWTDSGNTAQSVSLTALVPWISPRAGADQIAELTPPVLESPTGRALVGEGDLADYPDAQLAESPGDDGLSVYQNQENLLLVDGENHVLLTLLDACNTDTQLCTDFVKISGTVYVDTENTRQALEDTFVIASDAAYCSRWVTEGSISSPPRTDRGDYEYYHYTCYLGGGWHGNIGFVATDGLLQTDKVCQGDPTSLNAWQQPVIALRRAYRGMLHYTLNGEVVYKSHGIADATQFSGHDFVFTQLPVDRTEGVYCSGLDGPMTRTDSRNGALFAGVPTDFFCLNQDLNFDSAPDYLDAYDTSFYGAGTTCPYDPTDPPVRSWSITGSVGIVTATSLDLRNFSVTTSDGPGNCVVTAFESIDAGYVARYSCTVYDWGSGWTGFVQLQTNNAALYCADDQQAYTGITADQSRHFTCLGGDAVVVQGRLELGDRLSVTAMAVVDLLTGRTGYCAIGDLSYRCVLPYEGQSASLAIAIETDGAICGWPDAVMMFEGYTAADGPYRHDLFVVARANLCPVL